MDTFGVSQHRDYALMVYLFDGAHSLTRASQMWSVANMGP